MFKEALLDLLWVLRLWWKRLLPPRWHREARQAGFYPAYGDFVEYFVLDKAGGVWFRPDDEPWTAAAPVRELELQHVARVEAARWSREMQRFSPERQADWQACPSCHGKGYAVPPRHRHRFLCECGGLGWVPPTWNTGNRVNPWERGRQPR